MKQLINLFLVFVLLQPAYAFSESEDLKILVVGAGISGLGAAKDLHMILVMKLLFLKLEIE